MVVCVGECCVNFDCNVCVCVWIIFGWSYVLRGVVCFIGVCYIMCVVFGCGCGF